MLCIQVPIREMSWPPKKSWKLRWWKARRVAGNPIARAAEPVRACGSELGELLNRNLSKPAYIVRLVGSAAVPVAVVGRFTRTRRGQMPSRQPARFRRDIFLPNA